MQRAIKLINNSNTIFEALFEHSYSLSHKGGTSFLSQVAQTSYAVDESVRARTYFKHELGKHHFDVSEVREIERIAIGSICTEYIDTSLIQSFFLSPFSVQINAVMTSSSVLL